MTYSILVVQVPRYIDTVRKEFKSEIENKLVRILELALQRHQASLFGRTDVAGQNSILNAPQNEANDSRFKVKVNYYYKCVVSQREQCRIDIEWEMTRKTARA